MLWHGHDYFWPPWLCRLLEAKNVIESAHFGTLTQCSVHPTVPVLLTKHLQSAGSILSPPLISVCCFGAEVNNSQYVYWCVSCHLFYFLLVYSRKMALVGSLFWIPSELYAVIFGSHSRTISFIWFTISSKWTGGHETHHWAGSRALN